MSDPNGTYIGIHVSIGGSGIEVERDGVRYAVYPYSVERRMDDERLAARKSINRVRGYRGVYATYLSKNKMQRLMFSLAILGIYGEDGV